MPRQTPSSLPLLPPPSDKPYCEYSSICTRYALDGHDGKCILHSENSEKNEETFKEALEEHREEHGPNFRRMVFPARADFEDATFGGDASFKNATFKGEADFRRATFEGEGSFQEATFEDAARFAGGNFGSPAITFGGGAATFEGKADFWKTTFEDQAVFANTMFKDEARFGQGELESTAATFEGPVSFMDTTFEDKADFGYTTFEGQILFGSATFERKASFKNATFEGQILFGNAKFKRKASFREVTFEDEARFAENELESASVTFERKADFWETTFEGPVVFAKVMFKGEADFRRATFEGEGSFQEATFEDKASFSSTFKGRADFRYTMFEGQTFFVGATFEKQVRFVGKSARTRLFDNAEVAFTDVTYDLDTPPRFRFVDLSRCSFLRTDLRDVEFIGIKWCDELPVEEWFSLDWLKGEEWFRRVGLYDEVVENCKRRSLFDVVQTTVARMGSPDGPHWTLFEVEEDSEDDDEEERWREVERLYRQLKRNYEERGDFPRGGDFHIGEKEARRKSSETSGPLKFLLYAYRAFSKYGERAIPAVISLLVVVLGCAVVYSLCDATLIEEAAGHTLGIADPDGPLTFSESLRVSLEASFYPVRPVGFEDLGPYILSVFQRLFSPFLLALLALALRQRVKR